ncbi:hypothetical protein HPB47_022763 [Ixodes persulcatus]|uniref:Uncharacterized protein n=1 Tax=Ixodes persulcatus TaxID=34615 RepID=A0AC60Q8U1_IXOPE|nr:hypothetical protein HPB47_022763 [Ixodes persulcatus]
MVKPTAPGTGLMIHARFEYGSCHRQFENRARWGRECATCCLRTRAKCDIHPHVLAQRNRAVVGIGRSVPADRGVLFFCIGSMKPGRLGGARAGRPTTEANGRSHPSEPRKMAARLPLARPTPEIRSRHAGALSSPTTGKNGPVAAVGSTIGESLRGDTQNRAL